MRLGLIQLIVFKTNHPGPLLRYARPPSSALEAAVDALLLLFGFVGPVHVELGELLVLEGVVRILLPAPPFLFHLVSFNLYFNQDTSGEFCGF